MTTHFPPSTFPTMSLGAPANLIASSSNNDKPRQPPPPPADVPSVLAAIRSCSSHEASVRRPAEEQLQQWENSYSGMLQHAAIGYLTSLVTIIDSSNNTGSNADATTENIGLMSAILLKNGIPKVFGAPLPKSPNEGADADVLNRLQQERGHVRNQLPALLFRDGNATRALHLQLALSNVALFDFPDAWPTLLEDLAGVASGQQRPSGSMDELTARIRAIKTLRLCLQSIRQRKIIVQKGGGGGSRGNGNNPMMMLNMRNLGSIIGKAVHERRAMHDRACSIFGSLAEGIVSHAQAAVSGVGGSVVVVASSAADLVSDSAWSARCTLAVDESVPPRRPIIPVL